MFSNFRLPAGVSLGVLLLFPIATYAATVSRPTLPQILASGHAGSAQRLAEFAKTHPLRKGAFGGYYLLTPDSFIHGNEGTACTYFSAPSSGGLGTWSSLFSEAPYTGTYYLSGRALRVWGAFYDSSGSTYVIVDAQGKLKGKGAAGNYDEGFQNGELFDFGTVTLSPPASSSGCPPSG